MTTTTAPPTLARRLNDAVMEVKWRLPIPDQTRLKDVGIRLVAGYCPCERLERNAIYAEFWSSSFTVFFYAGRIEGLADLELETLVAHELGHVFDFLEGGGGGEDRANRNLTRWGFEVEFLPGWRAQLAFQEAIRFRPDDWPD
jgi:hypothetical protein